MNLVTPAGLEKLTTELAVLRLKREALLEGSRQGPKVRAYSDLPPCISTLPTR